MASVMLTLMAMVMALPITGEVESLTATDLHKDWELTMASVMLMLMANARLMLMHMAMAMVLLGTGEAESLTATGLLKD